MLSLSSYPVVDSHCHPFLPEKEVKSFEQYLTLSDIPQSKADLVNTLLFRQVARELSRLLDVKGSSEEVIEERRRRYREDPAEYLRLLFEDARIEAMLVDMGYPSKPYSGYSIDLKDFSRLVPCDVREIFRVEIQVHDLVNEQFPFDKAVEEFHDRVRGAVKGGVVGLKSVIAYRTGLGIQRKDEDEVKRVWEGLLVEAKGGKSARTILAARTARVKAVFDYFVFLGIGDSVELGVPFQIHTGIGDSPSIDLRRSNPILLYDLMNDAVAKNAKIVLTHGGYPYHAEAGFIVNAYPNVYLDLSETIPFTSIGVKSTLLSLLGMAPTTKIMHGSDGFNIPELYWFAALQAKRSLAEALDELIESQEIDEEYAMEIARRFLSENAKRVYNL